MGAEFASASTRYLTTTSSVPVYPFCVGFWVYPTTTGTARTLWSASDLGATNHYYGIRQRAADTFGIYAAGGGTESETNQGTVTANAWHYIIGRFISNANRTIQILNSNGSAVSANTVTNRTATGLDVNTIGALRTSSGDSELFDGVIAEFWRTNADIWPDENVSPASILRLLAYGGPFSVPFVAPKVVEYISLRKHPTSDGDDIGENYVGSIGRQSWTNTNGVTTGHHPPLPHLYEKPGQRRSTLII